MALPVASPRLEVGGKGMVARVTCVAKGCLLDFVLSGGGQPSSSFLKLRLLTDRKTTSPSEKVALEGHPLGEAETLGF